MLRSQWSPIWITACSLWRERWYTPPASLCHVREWWGKEVSPKCIKINHCASNWIKLHQIESNWIKMNQNETNWIELDRIGSNWIKMHLNESKWIKVIKTNRNRFHYEDHNLKYLKTSSGSIALLEFIFSAFTIALHRFVLGSHSEARFGVIRDKLDASLLFNLVFFFFPSFSKMHDFAITENYSLFLDFPLRFHLDSIIKSGGKGKMFVFEPVS